MSEMNVSGAAGAPSTYTGYQTKGTEEHKDHAKAESSGRKKQNEKAKTEAGASYEKGKETKSATYQINKMSASERASVVAKLKADQESRSSQLASLVSKMMTGQANTFAKTDDNMWRILAGGNFSVDAATKAQAQADIAEDGYWGVKQTAQRLFDFASALAGDDVEKMKEMQAAMEKGFKKAEKTWGGSLPAICQNTIKAANQMFEDYYASKKTEE